MKRDAVDMYDLREELRKFVRRWNYKNGDSLTISRFDVTVLDYTFSPVPEVVNMPVDWAYLGSDDAWTRN